MGATLSLPHKIWNAATFAFSTIFKFLHKREPKRQPIEFLDVPTEVRMKIYGMVFDEPSMIFVAYKDQPGETCRDSYEPVITVMWSHKALANITQTCHKIRNETLLELQQMPVKLYVLDYMIEDQISIPQVLLDRVTEIITVPVVSEWIWEMPFPSLRRILRTWQHAVTGGPCDEAMLTGMPTSLETFEPLQAMEITRQANTLMSIYFRREYRDRLRNAGPPGFEVQLYYEIIFVADIQETDFERNTGLHLIINLRTAAIVEKRFVERGGGAMEDNVSSEAL